MEAWIWIIIIGGLIWYLKSKYSKNTSNTGHSRNSTFSAIADKYHTYEEVQEALRVAGLESSNLIVGVDFTRSNENTGKYTFAGRSLHNISNDFLNPYQHAITIIGKTLEVFDDDKLIPAYGFGDIVTTDKQVFPFNSGRPCHTFREVLDRYNEIAQIVVMSGPTSFAPIIREAISIIRNEKSYHILLIIADGQVTNERDTKKAIVEASQYPLSIVLVGVGDGPWDMMREFDDGLPSRQFDNFQFVEFHKFFNKNTPYDNPELAFAIAALQEIPDQFKEIRRLELL